MKKHLITLAFLLFSGACVFAQADNIVGIWVPAKGTSQVRIYKADNGKYYGRVEWKKEDKDELDVNNPDERLRSNKILGSVILKDFVYNSNKQQWEDGTVYDPDNGKTYDCYIWFDGNSNTKLTLKGYVLGMKFIGRSEEWTREYKIRE
ncbi:MAG: DUF2147 domain-containing protein [Bacteroidales bacterium]|nr:DUF2147 domain-containing protein [Bacteroidales bacterium]